MKVLFFTLLIFLFVPAHAQYTPQMPNDAVTQTDIAQGKLVAAPRFRVNRTASMTLSTTWQRVDFNGVSAANVNTFTGTPKMVEWDSVNKLFKFNSSIDRNYDYTFFYTFTGGLRPAYVIYRFVIPRPVPEGGNYYFPFPDESDPYADLISLETINEFRDSRNSTLYANSLMRSYGLGLEVKLKAYLLTPPSLTSASFIIYGR